MAQSPEVRFYDAQYSQFGSRLYAEIRSRAFGQDIGQNGWLTAEEHDLFISWLDPAPGSSVLDIACGSGRTTLRIAQARGCTVFGVDMHEQGIAGATEAAMRLGLSERAFFRVADAARDLPYQDASFDALICNDAVNHLPDRAAVFREWLRVLKPGGRLVFTDPIVVTGPLTNAEIAIRSSIGFYLFVPAGLNERLLVEAGFAAIDAHDRTENMARTAEAWRLARAASSDELRQIEGEETFIGQQTFLEVTARLAAEARLSRIAYRAVRP